MKFDKHIFDAAMEISVMKVDQSTTEEIMEVVKAMHSNPAVGAYIKAAIGMARINLASALATQFHVGFEAGVDYANLMREHEKNGVEQVFTTAG